MTDSLGDRVEELRAEAARLNLVDDLHLYDHQAAVMAYADLLGLDQPAALDLSLTLPQIRRVSEFVG